MADLCSGLNIPQEVGQVRYLETESTWTRPHTALVEQKLKAEAQQKLKKSKAQTKQNQNKLQILVQTLWLTLSWSGWVVKLD